MTDNNYGPGMLAQIREANGFHWISPTSRRCSRCQSDLKDVVFSFTICPKAKLEFVDGILFDTNPMNPENNQ